VTRARRSSQRSRLAALSGLFCPLALACASYSPHHTARLTPPGTNEVSLAADALVVDRGLGPEVLGLPEFALSRGVSEDWDAGGRLYPFGVELSGKRRLVRDGNTQVSVMPLFAVSQVTATNADTSFVDLNAGAVLLNGIELGSKLALNVGFRSQLRLGLNAVAVREDFAAARWALLTGASAALSWRVSAQATLVPGVVVLAPYDFDRDDWDFPIVQAGCAVTW